MADITAADVKSLRDATGAGMMDAKKALVEADGDRQKAAQILRQKGLSKVATLEDRENNQGAVAIATAGNAASLVELKSETDFSAKADDFVALTQRLADAVLADGEGAVEGLKDDLDSLKISKRENIELGKVVRFEAADGNVLDAYVHIQDGRGTNAVLLEVEGADIETAHEIALHIAFAKPSALARDEIDPGLVETARSGFEELTIKEGKPEQAVPKIVEGRMNSWYGERVLPEQGMFGDKETVQQRLGDGRIVRFAQAVIGD
ncbi:translation elongation factor Ts [Dermatobacter hominis]|uniref:translation elongation factor Ts n=1 Tax=Dermatobacter hominis TaxID=2884263 RepID=UPI001D12BDC1|nr:translation elongation factor Ts [Dermatobacter hominis]UDY36863.1 translation elongation factor Ts [Dermatobacter hominis]